MSGESERKRDAGRERGGAHAEAGHRHSVASGRAHPQEHDSHIATAKETPSARGRSRQGRENLFGKCRCCRARGAQTWLLMQSLSHAGVTMGTPPRAIADCTCACTHECMFVCCIHGVYVHVHARTRALATGQTERQTGRESEQLARMRVQGAQEVGGQCRAGCV